ELELQALAPKLEAGDREPLERVGAVAAGADLIAARRSLADLAQHPGVPVVVEVGQPVEVGALLRPQRRLGMVGEQLVPGLAPVRAGGSGIVRGADLGVEGEDAALPVEQLERFGGGAHPLVTIRPAVRIASMAPRRTPTGR